MIRLPMIFSAAVGLLLATHAPWASAAIVPGQIDNFESGTLQSWQAGGVVNPNGPMNIATGGPAGSNDNFLQLTSNGGFGAGGKLVVFNTNQWSGDYLGAGINSITMDVRNLGTTDLLLRLILVDHAHAQSLTTSAAVSVTAGGNWSNITFPLNTASLTGGAFDTVMGSVSELNLVHSEDVISARSSAPSIAAKLGIDNITAVPNVIPAASWNVDADGNWTQAPNWTSGVPNSVDTDAVFGNVITAPRTVTVDAAISVGSIAFDNASPYTIAGDNVLTFDVGSNEAEITVMRGSHTVGAPVTLADNTKVSVSPAEGNLTFSGGVTAAAVDLTKVGPGTLTLHHLRAGGLAIDEGKVAVAAAGTAGASVVGSLSIAGTPAEPTGQLDMSKALVLDYSGDSPENSIREQILSGRGGPSFGASWAGMGINSSAVAATNAVDGESQSVAYAENASLPLGAYGEFRGQQVDDTSVLMAVTRTGDANLDGVVNDDDVTILGAFYAPGVPQASWAFGDFDYNGFVDDDDITLLGAFYDPSAPPLAAPAGAAGGTLTAVPEPSTLWIALLGVALAVMGRRPLVGRCRS